MVPGGAPDCAASMTMTSLAPSHASISVAPSPVFSITATPSSSASRISRAAMRPAASSPRYSLPIPMKSARAGNLLTVGIEPQQVRRTGNTRVVVADGVLALEAQLIGWKVEMLWHEAPQVFLDDLLVLRRRRNDLGVEDDAAFIDAITVVEHTAGRFGPRPAGCGARLQRH